MRTIKFKYTCVRENGFVFSKVFHISEIESGFAENWMKVNITETGLLYRRQFTGLYDKNGNEIYDGDILNWKYPVSESNEFTHIVKWDEVWACFGLYDLDSNYCKESDWYRVIDREVIGNIYENPELIKP